MKFGAPGANLRNPLMSTITLMKWSWLHLELDRSREPRTSKVGLLGQVHKGSTHPHTESNLN